MSLVWSYFKLEKEDSPSANCSVCSAEVSRGGLNRAAFKTSNLRKHLKKHAKEYDELTQKEQNIATVKQLTLEATPTRKEKFPCESTKAKKITEQIAKLIALDNQPIYIVDDIGFLHLLFLLEPRYALPS